MKDELIFRPEDRVLQLLKWLQEETDAWHFLSFKDLERRRKENDLFHHPPSLIRDINTLRKYGYDIRWHGNMYWLAGKIENKDGTVTYPLLEPPLTDYEVGILMDALQVFPACSEETKGIILSKLQTLLPDNSLHSRPVVTDRYCSMDGLEMESTLSCVYHAMEDHVKIKYLEYTYVVRPEFHRKIRKEEIYFSPYYIRHNRTHYYMVGWSEKTDQIEEVRLDTICRVGMTQTNAHPLPADFPIPKSYPDRFSIRKGPRAVITLQCEEPWLDEIVHVFGPKLYVKNIRGKCEVKVETEINEDFSSWLAGTCGGITMIKVEYTK